MSLPYEEVSFTKDGHTYQPGDPIIALTTSAGQPTVHIGKYLGTREGKGRWGTTGTNVVMDVQSESRRLVHNVTGEIYDHHGEYKNFPYPKYPQWGTPTYAADNEVYRKKVAERNEAVAKAQADYTWTPFKYWSRTTLKRNRIYPGDIALKEFVPS